MAERIHQEIEVIDGPSPARAVRSTQRFVVASAYGASEVLDALRAVVPDLRDAGDAPEGEQDEIVIVCSGDARATRPARYARLGPAAPANDPAADALPVPDRLGLSERQSEVARLLAAGHSNAEIAARLGLSVYTARNHATRVLQKLGVRRRSGVGVVLLRDVEEEG